MRTELQAAMSELLEALGDGASTVEAHLAGRMVEADEARAIEVLFKVLGILDGTLQSAALDLKSLHKKFSELGRALPGKRQDILALQGALEQGIDLLTDLRKIAPLDFQDLKTGPKAA